MSLIKVWDAPLRIFHWLLVLAVIAAYITAEIGGEWADWHGRIGIFILGLLVFRLIWGFVGSYYARFASFFPTFARLSQYFNGRWHAHGHNPLGAFSVFALLFTLLAQVITGLFANDDIAFEGPLFGLVNKELSDQLTSWHGLIFDGLTVLIALHLVAIAFYWLVKKTNLVRPMVTGYKLLLRDAPAHAASEASAEASQWVLFVAILIAALVVWLVQCGIVAAWFVQAAPAAVSTQNW